MDFTKEAIEKVIDLAAPHFHQIGAYEYTDKELKRVRLATPEAIDVSTLEGLIGIIKAEALANEDHPLLVHVDAPAHVSVFGPIRSDESRREFYKANPEIPAISYGSYIPIEDMIIMLRTRFVQNDDITGLIACIGNMKSFNAQKVADDGVSQTVTILEGIESQENAVIEPIRELFPFRTFTEVEQPGSKFLFRLKNGRDMGVHAAIFEADGYAWRVEAAKRVRMWLAEKLKGIEGITVIQ